MRMHNRADLISDYLRLADECCIIRVVNFLGE